MLGRKKNIFLKEAYMLEKIMIIYSGRKLVLMKKLNSNNTKKEPRNKSGLYLPKKVIKKLERKTNLYRKTENSSEIKALQNKEKL